MSRQGSALYAALPVLASVLGCAGSGGPVEAAPAPVAPPAAPTAAIEPNSPAPIASARAPEEPLPLRAGTDGGFSPTNSQRSATACAPDTIRRTLEDVVAQCRRAGASLCGELKVRASADGKSVQVTLDVAKDSFDDSFSRCVTSRLDAVAWRCTLPGSDTTLDLGCDL